MFCFSFWPVLLLMAERQPTSWRLDSLFALTRGIFTPALNAVSQLTNIIVIILVVIIRSVVSPVRVDVVLLLCIVVLALCSAVRSVR